MSNYEIQIKCLFEQGNSPSDIATMMNMELTSVLIVLNNLGLIRGGSAPTGDAKVDDAAEVFRVNQKEIAQRIVDIARYEDNNISAAVKAAIYIREEATGRNESRAKKNGGIGKIINIGNVLLQMDQARKSVEKSLTSTPVLQLEG